MRFYYILLPLLCLSLAAGGEVVENPFNSNSNSNSNSGAAANAAAPPVQQQKQEKAPTLPDIKPYQIPRFNGKEGEDFRHIPAIKPTKEINSDAVFNLIVRCYPERSAWGNITIKGQLGARYTDRRDTISSLDNTGLARHYVGIVAEMPLFAPDETYRQQEQERMRRAAIAQNIGALVKAIADRHRAWRSIGIAESVEARSQLRVQRGIAPAEEQIGYLRDVAAAVGDLDAANAALDAARLTLAGQCRESEQNRVNQYLTELTK